MTEKVREPCKKPTAVVGISLLWKSRLITLSEGGSL